MLLYLDTTTDSAEIALHAKKKIIARNSWVTERNLSQELLPRIDKLLKRAEIALCDLKGIAILPGPGDFTNLRVGLSTANALAFALKIPLYAIKDKNKIFPLPQKTTLVKPVYDKEPKITKEKNPKLQ